MREQARRQAATSNGLVIETQARFGFTAAPSTTDDARLRVVNTERSSASEAFDRR
ncbi:hypothetical protein K1Y78_41180 [Streptomyces sp. tea 10]|nr:hypothetical protein [Streptomyces sp. tea 10]